MATDAEDAKMLLNTPSSMNVINYQLAPNLLDTCFDNILQILCKSSLYFAKIWKIGYSKITKFGL